MSDQDWLAERFEEHRARLRQVAYRMLGSAAEADDAVQDAWLRASRAGARDVENVGGWLTTIVARVCLNLLRSRRTRREAPLVVLKTLSPPERVAFVLHDMFAVPFDEIARMLDTSSAAARQLASRGRRRVRIAATPEGSLEAQREVVDAFFAAARRGDFEALISVLDPDVVLRSDGGAERALTTSVEGAAAVAGRALMFANPAAMLHPVSSTA